MLNKGTASLEVSRSHEQRLEPRVREFREFGTASLRGITVISMLCHKVYRFISIGSQKSMGSIEPIEPLLTTPLLYQNGVQFS